MTNVTPTALNPVAHRQMAAALALASILDHGLPAAHWTISDNSAGLDAQVYRSSGSQAERDAQEREVVMAFAQFLGTNVQEKHSCEARWTMVEVYGVYKGVKVRVWATVDDVAAIAQEAATAPAVRPVCA